MDNYTKDRPICGLGTTSEGSYGIYLTSKGELAFVYENFAKRELNLKKNISVSFYPEEISHVIEGLLYQSAKGLGRTSVKQLIDIVEYRFSDEFPRELEDMNERIGR